MKKKFKDIKFFFVLFSFIIIMSLNSFASDRSIGSFETGITQIQEVPFSKETIEEIKERDSKQPPSIPEKRVIPFHKEQEIELLPESKIPAKETNISPDFGTDNR